MLKSYVCNAMKSCDRLIFKDYYELLNCTQTDMYLQQRNDEIYLKNALQRITGLCRWLPNGFANSGICSSHDGTLELC